MIKRLGLAALLFLLSFAARAQFDYAAFGTLDLSYGRFENSGDDPRHRWNSNSLSASFVGAKASYGFENGWTAGINLETFIRFEELDYGRNEQDPFLSRNNFVSLQHNDYGLLRLGRMQTPPVRDLDPLQRLRQLDRLLAGLRQIFLSGNLESIDGDFYWDRAVSYKTPQIEDLNLQGHLMYAQGSGDNRGDYFGGSVVYSRGVFALSFVAQNVHVNNGIDDEVDELTLQLGGAYNFGVARLFGQYTHIDDKGNDIKSKLATVGVSVPLGPGTVLAQIARSTSKGPAVDRKHTTTSLGYVYNYEGIADFYVIGHGRPDQQPDPRRVLRRRRALPVLGALGLSSGSARSRPPAPAERLLPSPSWPASLCPQAQRCRRGAAPGCGPGPPSRRRSRRRRSGRRPAPASADSPARRAATELAGLVDAPDSTLPSARRASEFSPPAAIAVICDASRVGVGWTRSISLPSPSLPLRFEPQASTAPSRRRASACSRAAAIAITSLRPAGAPVSGCRCRCDRRDSIGPDQTSPLASSASE